MHQVTSCVRCGKETDMPFHTCSGEREAYKVCSLRNGKLMSALNDVVRSPFSVVYELGQLVTPKVGKLFVFDSLECAKHFLAFGMFAPPENKYVIWKVRAKNCILPPNIGIPSVGMMEEGIMQENWDIILNRAKTYNRSGWWYPVPEGTLFCDALTMLEEVSSLSQGGTGVFT